MKTGISKLTGLPEQAGCILNEVEDIGIEGVIEVLGDIIEYNITHGAQESLDYCRKMVNDSLGEETKECFKKERDETKEKIKCLKLDLKILRKIKLSGEDLIDW